MAQNKKEEVVEVQVEKEQPATKEKKIKKVKLISRNDFDVFIKYYDQEFCISPRGEVVCDEQGIKSTLPTGIFKVSV